MLNKNILIELYVIKKLSMQEISVKMHCSIHKVSYWMNKYEIKKRPISEAVYIKSNPRGDPFTFTNSTDMQSAYLLGLGLGLYWGEGNKLNKYSVRIGNTDPALLRSFITFLEKIFNIDKSKLKYNLQIFSDIEPDIAINYWQKELNFPLSALGKVTTTKSGSIGTYRNKNQYGVMSVYFHNKKLRDIMVGLLPR